MSMYPNQAKHYVDCINKIKKESVNIEDALKTQKIIDASFESSNQGKMIEII